MSNNSFVFELRGAEVSRRSFVGVASDRSHGLPDGLFGGSDFIQGPL